MSPRLLSPECRLVFRTANSHGASSEFVELIEGVTDWKRVLFIAEHEAAVANVARAMHAMGARAPDAVMTDVRRRALAIELRMHYLSRRLQETCITLADRGIPFMLLKGAALGAIVDPTFSTRPMNDADILVRPPDAPRAGEAIEASGWTSTRDEVLRKLLADAHHLPPFVDAQMPDLRVELHVAHLPATHPFEFGADVLWRDAQRANAPFAGALLPSLDHLVLHAALHFAWQHAMAFGAWRTFRTISAVTSQPGFQWNRFVDIAQAARAASSCYWTLRLAERLAGLAIPSDVLGQLAPPTPDRVRDALERHFIATIAIGEMPASPSVRVNHLLWLMAIRPGWSGHRTARNWDHENRWGKAYGTASTESLWQRLVRHATGYRRWSAFLTRTLAGQAPLGASGVRAGDRHRA